jgi:hypothetical protein
MHKEFLQLAILGENTAHTYYLIIRTNFFYKGRPNRKLVACTATHLNKGLKEVKFPLCM